MIINKDQLKDIQRAIRVFLWKVRHPRPDTSGIKAELKRELVKIFRGWEREFFVFLHREKVLEKVAINAAGYFLLEPMITKAYEPLPEQFRYVERLLTGFVFSHIDDLEEVLVTGLKRSYETGGKHAIRTMTNKIKPFTLRDPRVMGALQERANLLAYNTKDTTFNKIRSKIIEDFYYKGMTKNMVADDIQTIFKQTYTNRAEVVARTEIHHAETRASRETYQRSGVREKMWVTAGGTPCPLCAMMSGEIVPIDETFSNGLMGPEGEHPNGACEISPIMREDEKIRIEDVWTGGVI